MNDLAANLLGAIVRTVALDIFRSLLRPSATNRVLRVVLILTTAFFDKACRTLYPIDRRRPFEDEAPYA